jgi:hypothetical protein
MRLTAREVLQRCGTRLFRDEDGIPLFIVLPVASNEDAQWIEHMYYRRLASQSGRRRAAAAAKGTRATYSLADAKAFLSLTDAEWDEAARLVNEHNIDYVRKHAIFAKLLEMHDAIQKGDRDDGQEN